MFITLTLRSALQLWSYSFHRWKASCPISSTYGVKRVSRVHSYWTIETQGKTNNKLITIARVLFINNTAYACIWPVHFFAIKWITQWCNEQNIYIIDANFMNLCFYIAYKSKMQLHTYKVASKWEKHSKWWVIMYMVRIGCYLNPKGLLTTLIYEWLDWYIRDVISSSSGNIYPQVMIIVSLWNLTGIQTALLPKCL